MTALFRPASVPGETAAYAPPVATIPPEALADHYARIVAAHGEELKRYRRRERGGHLFSFLHGCTTVALAVALAALLPLKKSALRWQRRDDRAGLCSSARGRLLYLDDRP